MTETGPVHVGLSLKLGAKEKRVVMETRKSIITSGNRISVTYEMPFAIKMICAATPEQTFVRVLVTQTKQVIKFYMFE